MSAPHVPVHTRVAIVALLLTVAPLPGLRRVVTDLPAVTPVARVAAPTPRRQPSVADLRGRVESSDHAPLANAVIQAVLAHDGRTWPLGRASSGADGSFVIAALPEGSYWVVATAPGKARAITTARVRRSEGASVTLTLSEGSRIEGTVQSRGRDGLSALSGAIVRAWREGGAVDDLPYAAKADRHGRFTLDGVGAGSYRVEVAEVGFEALRRVGVPAPTSALALTVRALASLEGVVHAVHGEGARGATVVLAGSGLWPPRSVRVHDDGRFLISGLPSGVYELRASRDDDVAEPLAPLVLDPGDHREVELSLGSGATLEGSVVDAETRAPVANARVVVAEDALSTAPRALLADARGRFRVPGLLRRAHQVSVRAPGYAPRTGVAVNPTEGAATVALDRAAVLTGRVVDGHGDPVANTQVELSVRDHDGAVTWISGATVAFREALFGAQAQGPRPLVPGGELGVMPGRVPLIPLAPMPAGITADRAAPGFVTGADGTFRVEEVPPGVVVVTANHPAYVRGESEGRLVRAGETAELTVVLHRGGTIDGRVLSERGFPLRSTQVEVRSTTDPIPRRVFTLDDGTFRVPSVRGHVVLVALSGARIAARAEVDVLDDATVPVTLTVPGSLRHIEGRVTDARGFPVAGASVSITSLDRVALGSATTITHDDGTFDTVMGGAHAVNFEVRHPDYAPRGLRVDDPSRPVRIELSAGAAVEFELRSDGCMTAPARVELRSPCGPARTNVSDGESARIERLCSGRSVLVIDAPGCIRAERSVTVPTTGAARVGRIELGAGGGAEGDVVDAHGDPVAGAVIARLDAPPDALTGTARSDRRGLFAVQNLPEGDVSIVAWHPTLGRSPPVVVRVLRGTSARAVRLRFERDTATSTQAMVVRAVAFEDVTAGGVRAVEVRAVSPGGAPDRAGLRAGDRVVTMGGEAVTSAADAERRLGGAVGDDVVLEVERDGVRRTLRFAREAQR